MDITSYIAALSTNMSQASLIERASMGMLKNNLENSEAAAAEVMEMLPAPDAGQIGGLLDVTA